MRVTDSQAVAHISWLVRCSLALRDLAEAIHIVYTPMLFVCYLYVLMYNDMSLFCTRMSVFHSHAFVCHPYVTRMYSYVVCMLLVCGFTMNHYHMPFTLTFNLIITDIT